MIPRKLFVKQLLKTSTRPVITMTDHNKTMLEKSGYPAGQLFSIPPGKAPLPLVKESDSTCWDQISAKLDGRPYFLFFGPPHAIRGVRQILRAFRKVIEKNNEICLVCLFRSDKGMDIDDFKSKTEKLTLPQNRLFCIWGPVSGNDLEHGLGAERDRGGLPANANRRLPLCHLIEPSRPANTRCRLSEDKVPEG
jgi:glycosyltransferase involved in cell wall biosynthesis